MGQNGDKKYIKKCNNKKKKDFFLKINKKKLIKNKL